MLNLPSTMQTQFVVFLRNQAVPNEAHASHLKWLRYGLDFCEKYHFPQAQTNSLSHFLDKLHQKKQTHSQQQQACHAIMLYYEFVQHREPDSQFCSPQERIVHGKSLNKFRHPADFPPKRCNESIKDSSPSPVLPEPAQPIIVTPQRPVVSQGSSWKPEYARLSYEIKLRHYSPKTLRTSTQWVHHYQTFTRSKDPKSLSTQDV